MSDQIAAALEGALMAYVVVLAVALVARAIFAATTTRSHNDQEWGD
jgi:hypothetical protein